MVELQLLARLVELLLQGRRHLAVRLERGVLRVHLRAQPARILLCRAARAELCSHHLRKLGRVHAAGAHRVYQRDRHLAPHAGAACWAFALLLLARGKVVVVALVVRDEDWRDDVGDGVRLEALRARPEKAHQSRWIEPLDEAKEHVRLLLRAPAVDEREYEGRMIVGRLQFVAQARRRAAAEQAEDRLLLHARVLREQLPLELVEWQIGRALLCRYEVRFERGVLLLLQFELHLRLTEVELKLCQHIREVLAILANVARL